MAADLVGVEHVLGPVVAGHRRAPDDAPLEHDPGGDRDEQARGHERVVAAQAQRGLRPARQREPDHDERRLDQADDDAVERQADAGDGDQRHRRRDEAEHRRRGQRGDEIAARALGQQRNQREPRRDQQDGRREHGHVAAEQRDQRLDGHRSRTCEREWTRLYGPGGYDSVRGRTRERPDVRRPRRTGRCPGSGQRTIRAVPHGGRTPAGRAVHQLLPRPRRGKVSRDELDHGSFTGAALQAGARRRRDRPGDRPRRLGGLAGLGRPGRAARRLRGPGAAPRVSRPVRLLIVLAIAAGLIALAVALTGGDDSAPESSAAAQRRRRTSSGSCRRGSRRWTPRSWATTSTSSRTCTPACCARRSTGRTSSAAPNRFHFARYDALMAAAAQRGLRVLPVLFNPPGFHSAGPPRPSPRGTFPPRHPGDLGAFAKVVVRRYGPDGELLARAPRAASRTRSARGRSGTSRACPCTGRPGPDPKAYTRVLAATAKAIRGVDPGATIVSAGIPQSRIGVPFARYVEGMYRAGAKGAFDALAIHPYARDTAGVIAAIVQARRHHGPPRRPLADLGHRGRVGLRRAAERLHRRATRAGRSACAPRCWR